MSWDVEDISEYIVAVAKFGGPIGEPLCVRDNCKHDQEADCDAVALFRDPSKVVLLGKHNVGKPRINIYTAAGGQISSLAVSVLIVRPASGIR